MQSLLTSPVSGDVVASVRLSKVKSSFVLTSNLSKCQSFGKLACFTTGSERPICKMSILCLTRQWLHILITLFWYFHSCQLPKASTIIVSFQRIGIISLQRVPFNLISTLLLKAIYRILQPKLIDTAHARLLLNTTVLHPDIILRSAERPIFFINGSRSHLWGWSALYVVCQKEHRRTLHLLIWIIDIDYFDVPMVYLSWCLHVNVHFYLGPKLIRYLNFKIKMFINYNYIIFKMHMSISSQYRIF
jgi:hypothetical protein